MAKTFEFVYAMIIFILLFLVENNFAAYIIECQTDDDCPKSQLEMFAWKCVKNGCHLFGMYEDDDDP
ncbi:Nodule Cysteine-Rich (NCR) secreted peptide [Medicago truncatula]|nr:Nodule Cysteine-Rich (NCR) secreted peptide [Medicago truncatula]